MGQPQASHKRFFRVSPVPTGQLTDIVRGLYDCPHCGHTHHTHVCNLADDTQEPDELWQELLNNMYDGQVKPGTIHHATALATAKEYMKGIVQGFGTTLSKLDTESPDYGVLKNLQQNVYQFAGAKNYQTLRALNDLLRDGDRLRTRSEFMKEARNVLTEWNANWQKTEYDTAVNSAINARKWNDFVKQKDLMPLLQFKIVKDERTCPICLPFADMVRPITDPVWNYATPSLHFGDRCTILQLPDDRVPISPEVPPADGIPKMFRVNLAKEQLAFPPGHPYYKGVPKKMLREFVNTNLYGNNFLHHPDVVKNITSEIINAADAMQKHNLTREDLIGLAGGIPTSDITGININIYSVGSDKIKLNIKTDQYRVDRVLHLEKKMIYNALMKVNDKGGGIGTTLFLNQIKIARSLKFNSLTVSAAGEPGNGIWDGYYRCARLGYTMDEVSKAEYKRWAEYHNRTEKSVNMLVKTDDGFAYWKENGDSWTGKFNLANNSLNMKYLKSYLKSKKIDFEL